MPQRQHDKLEVAERPVRSHAVTGTRWKEHLLVGGRVSDNKEAQDNHAFRQKHPLAMLVSVYRCTRSCTENRRRVKHALKRSDGANRK